MKELYIKNDEDCKVIKSTIDRDNEVEIPNKMK